MKTSTRKATNGTNGKATNGKAKTVKGPQYSHSFGEYNGKPTLSLHDGPDADSYPIITFGKRKAKAIAACMDAILKFALED